MTWGRRVTLLIQIIWSGGKSLPCDSAEGWNVNKVKSGTKDSSWKFFQGSLKLGLHEIENPLSLNAENYYEERWWRKGQQRDPWTHPMGTCPVWDTCESRVPWHVASAQILTHINRTSHVPDSGKDQSMQTRSRRDPWTVRWHEQTSAEQQTTSWEVQRGCHVQIIQTRGISSKLIVCWVYEMFCWRRGAKRTHGFRLSIYLVLIWF